MNRSTLRIRIMNQRVPHARRGASLLGIILETGRPPGTRAEKVARRVAREGLKVAQERPAFRFAALTTFARQGGGHPESRNRTPAPVPDTGATAAGPLANGAAAGATSRMPPRQTSGRLPRYAAHAARASVPGEVPRPVSFVLLRVREGRGRTAGGLALTWRGESAQTARTSAWFLPLAWRPCLAREGYRGNRSVLSQQTVRHST